MVVDMAVVHGFGDSIVQCFSCTFERRKPQNIKMMSQTLSLLPTYGFNKGKIKEREEIKERENIKCN